ncbi:MAG: hypothetical protein P8K08_15855 [Fuerstiella sp.]|jgi:hypothetical protein|nr:hypothetical protein [Fuerstiella sp.]
MTRTLLFFMLVVGCCSAAPERSRANDIVDFLRALQTSSDTQHHSGVVHAAGHHGHHDRSHRSPHRTARGHRELHSRRESRSGISFSLSLGAGPAFSTVPSYINVPSHPDVLATAPALQQLHHVPFHLGDVVTCPVPLETCVRIKDADKIAPDAVPVAVAVRDPHSGRFGSRGCVEALVYVEVLVPTCSLQGLRVSPCRTKIRLDYGHHAVDIVSRNGVVRIDYDD